MKEEIKEKLRIALVEPIEKECQVVYIMVEIRKFLDDDNNEKYPLLKFYCNWVLHTEINSLTAARDILNKIAEEHKKGNFGEINLNFVNFSHLKEQMESFFQENNLPIDILKNEEKWRKFRGLLINIIKDCPLKIKPELKPILIEEFSFKNYEETFHNGFKNLTVEWEYKLVDNPNNFFASSTEIINRESK